MKNKKKLFALYSVIVGIFLTALFVAGITGRVYINGVTELGILVFAVPALGQILTFLGVIIFLRMSFKKLHPTLLVLASLLAAGLLGVLSSLLSLLLPVISS